METLKKTVYVLLIAPFVPVIILMAAVSDLVKAYFMLVTKILRI